jgi:translation initiation factor IF-2
MIVAVNKMDLPGADPLRVRTELTNHGVVVEELGGDVPSVEVSAVNGTGLDDLLEVIDLIAQLEDFKANAKPAATGVVVEAQLEVGRGPVATVIVQRGTLKQGDAFVAGPIAGRVRALMNDQGDRIEQANPSDPVQIMGWDDVPAAGDFFEVQKSDRDARKIADDRQEEQRQEAHVAPSARDRLQGLLDQLRSEDATLNVIVIVTHNMQQAARVSDYTAFFWLGRLIEYDRTEKVFTNPAERLTEDYVTGRFG